MRKVFCVEITGRYNSMIIELIHPPHPNSTDDRLDPPLGLLLIASHLRNTFNDIQIKVNDLSGREILDIGYADIFQLPLSQGEGIAQTVSGEHKAR